MPKKPAMSAPVTHGQLRSALEPLEQKIEALEQRFDVLEQRIDGKLDALEQRMDLRSMERLEIWAGALREQILASAAATDQRMGAMEQRLMTELGRHTKASAELLSAQVAVVDEKYADLPGRVTRLEDAAHVQPLR